MLSTCNPVEIAFTATVGGDLRPSAIWSKKKKHIVDEIQARKRSVNSKIARFIEASSCVVLNHIIVLCSWARHFTLTVPLSSTHTGV